MVILDKMILTGRICEFVQEFVKIKNEELADQTRWEFWLHKVFDMSFADFLAKSENNRTEGEIPSDEVLEMTVKDSMGMIIGFCPS